MSTHSGRELTDAIILALRNAGLVVGDGDKENGAEDAGWQGAPGVDPFDPYVVVFPTPGGFYDGTLGCTFTVANPDYTISAFGKSREQAQWGADQVFATLTVPSNVTVAGRSVQIITPDVDGGVLRDDDVGGSSSGTHIYWSPTRWRVMTTDAA